ncbi:MAG: hypothetical protein AB8B68_02175 [Rickettsiaceae bacterium]
MKSQRNKELLTQTSERLGYSEEQVMEHVPFYIKLVADCCNDKVLGGYLKRMTAEESSYSVVCRQTLDDVVSHPIKYALIACVSIVTASYTAYTVYNCYGEEDFTTLAGEFQGYAGEL